MKKTLALFLILCVMVALITGCGENTKDIEMDFHDLIERPASEENLSAISDFLDQYLSKVGEESASDMVLKYEDYILNFDSTAIDYGQWLEKYKGNICDALIELYNIKEREQNNPISKDAIMQVSWMELASRTYEMEEYLENYKEDKSIYEDASWIYENYMTTMIMGTNGTPIFDYESYEFSQEAVAAYTSFIDKYPDATTTWALKEYLTYLNDIEYKMDYRDKELSKQFFDTCTWLVSESGKRVFQ